MVPLLEHNAKAYQAAASVQTGTGIFAGTWKSGWGRWLYKQKVLLRRQSPKLNVEQMEKLEKLLEEGAADKAG